MGTTQFQVDVDHLDIGRLWGGSAFEPQVDTEIMDLIKWLDHNAPGNDYDLSVASTATGTFSWKLQTLIPHWRTTKLIRIRDHVTPIPYAPGSTGHSYGTVYVRFIAPNGGVISHVNTCWSNEGHRYGFDGEPLYVTSNPDTKGPEIFSIQSNNLEIRSEYVDGGMIIRLYHPGWIQWAKQAYGAYDEIEPAGNHMAGLGNGYEKTLSPGVQSVINLGGTRPVTSIRQRFWASLADANQYAVWEYYDVLTNQWLEGYRLTGPKTQDKNNAEYAQVDFSSAKDVSKVRCSVVGGSIGIFHPFVWGPDRRMN